MIWALWALVTYLFLGVWVAVRKVDWDGGVQFHSKFLPFARWSKTHIVLATVAQLALIALLWPFYGRQPMPFYKGGHDPEPPGDAPGDPRPGDVGADPDRPAPGEPSGTPDP